MHSTFVARSLLMIAVAVSACATGGANHYRNALTQQERCCHGLADAAARQACLADIPRTDDPASALNQETFQCVEGHFQCNPATGRATLASAQLQLDCLNDLASTQEARGEATVH